MGVSVTFLMSKCAENGATEIGSLDFEIGTPDLPSHCAEIGTECEISDFIAEIID